MNKIFTVAALALCLESCSGTATLPRGNWAPTVYTALRNVLDSCQDGNYAVFDFDNTSIMGDVEMNTMAWQTENLRFAFDTSRALTVFTDCIPALDSLIPSLGVSFRALAEDLASDYSALYGKPFDEARMLPEYVDFKAKCWALAAATDEVFGYETGCLWPLRLFDRMTYAQIDSLTEEAVEWSLGLKEPYIDTWESPVMGKAGKICVSFSRGIRIAPELPQLYSALAEKGIKPYICSASMERVVEELACNPKYGFGLDRSQVFGIRLDGGQEAEDTVGTSYAKGYPMTFMEGKVETIKTYIAPMFEGKDPVLVAGDSNGDYNMLTEFPGMRHGLIFNRDAKPPIRNLYVVKPDPESIPGKYVLQGRYFAAGTLVRDTENKD